MKLEWQQAPVKTQWGDDMMVASVAIDKDHTVDLYCEREQTPKVEAMFAQQEPVAKKTRIGLVTSSGWDSLPVGTEFYTSPPAQRKPLTIDEINDLAMQSGAFDEQLLAFARAIEAAHGIKENA